MKDFKYLLILTLLSILMGCGGKKASNDQTTFVPGYWGQLAELELLSSTPLFLIYVKPTDIYKVCVATHLVDEHPQILNQIDASIKIWGRYINREIQTEIYTFKMQAPSATEHQNTTFKKYGRACPNADVAVGYGNISSVGQTASQYSSYQGSNGLKIVRNAEKVVFLQNPAFNGRRWVSPFDKSSPVTSVEDMLTMMMKRDQQQFLTDQKELSILTVMVHEFGHVWGLCDMYPLGNGHTNCDPIWSKKDQDGQLILNPHAMMSSVGWRNPLFLHDDDIEGIRTLAARTRFHSEWKNQKSFDSVTPITDTPFFFSHLDSKITNGNLAFTFALYNTHPITLEMNMMSDRGPLNYQPMNITDSVDTPQYTLNLGMPENLTIQRLEVIIKDEQGNELVKHQETFTE